MVVYVRTILHRPTCGHLLQSVIDNNYQFSLARLKATVSVICWCNCNPGPCHFVSDRSVAPRPPARPPSLRTTALDHLVFYVLTQFSKDKQIWVFVFPQCNQLCTEGHHFVLIKFVILISIVSIVSREGAECGNCWARRVRNDEESCESTLFLSVYAIYLK